MEKNINYSGELSSEEPKQWPSYMIIKNIGPSPLTSSYQLSLVISFSMSCANYIESFTYHEGKPYYSFFPLSVQGFKLKKKKSKIFKREGERVEGSRIE